MQNKKLFVSLGILILVGVAAFVAGRMLNSRIDPLSLLGIRGSGDVINVIPAEELPTTRPEVIGEFVERNDKTIILQLIPMKIGTGGMIAPPPAVVSGTNQVEVIITNETIIYQDTTSDLNGPPPGADHSIQQTLEESTLDKLNTQSVVTIWGTQSGDRIIAKVLVYSNPVVINRP